MSINAYACVYANERIDSIAPPHPLATGWGSRLPICVSNLQNFKGTPFNFSQWRLTMCVQHESRRLLSSLIPHSQTHKTSKRQRNQGRIRMPWKIFQKLMRELQKRGHDVSDELKLCLKSSRQTPKLIPLSYFFLKQDFKACRIQNGGVGISLAQWILLYKKVISMHAFNGGENHRAPY